MKNKLYWSINTYETWTKNENYSVFHLFYKNKEIVSYDEIKENLKLNVNKDSGVWCSEESRKMVIRFIQAHLGIYEK